MSQGGSTVHRVAIYLLLFNLILPVFAYAFIDIAGASNPAGSFEYITKEELLNQGIFLLTQERYELEFEGPHIEFNASGKPVRVQWNDGGILREDNFIFYTRSVADFLGTWFFINRLNVVIDGTTHEFLDNYVRNETIVYAYSDQYNWTRASVPAYGLELFFTCEAAGGNMTQAVYDDGVFNVTLGTTMDYEDMNAAAFIDWYWGLLSNESVYGLPIYVKWIFQIQAVLLIFTAVIIGRELTRV